MKRIVLIRKIVKSLTAAVCAAAMMIPIRTHAQNEFSVSGKADFVSEYVWRGLDQHSGFSVQPSLTLSYGGLSLNAWGSRSLTNEAKEFDINLSYAVNGFSLTVSDYWWTGANQPYGDYRNSHYFEATAAYSFGESFPLSLSWSTMFAGGKAMEADGIDVPGSTYINTSFPIALPADITLTPAIGITPWEGMYWNKFAVTDISLKANKDIKVTESFSVPVFVQAIVAPVFDRTYLVAGFSIGF